MPEPFHDRRPHEQTRRREPLRVELEAFRDLVMGDDDAPVVGLEAGLLAVEAAEAVLRSARSGATEPVRT